MACSSPAAFCSIRRGRASGARVQTRKITQAAARISLGQQDELVLGDLWPKRDWGYAGDYVRGMWQMMQHDVPDDFVLASGETHSVEDFCSCGV